jgi:hypothetical protein
MKRNALKRRERNRSGSYFCEFGIWIQNGDWIGGKDKRIIGKGCSQVQEIPGTYGAVVYMIPILAFSEFLLLELGRSHEATP